MMKLLVANMSSIQWQSNRTIAQVNTMEGPAQVMYRVLDPLDFLHQQLVNGLVNGTQVKGEGKALNW